MYQVEIVLHSFEARMKVNILEGSLWHLEHSGYPCWSVLLCWRDWDCRLQRGADASNEIRKGNRTSPTWIKPKFPQENLEIKSPLTREKAGEFCNRESDLTGTITSECSCPTIIRNLLSQTFSGSYSVETNWSVEENGQQHSGRGARKRQRHPKSLLVLMAYQKKTES